MKYKLVKKLNKKISTIGLGTWSLSNTQNSKFFYKKISKKKIIKILNKSYDYGLIITTHPQHMEKAKIF